MRRSRRRPRCISPRHVRGEAWSGPRSVGGAQTAAQKPSDPCEAPQAPPHDDRTEEGSLAPRWRAGRQATAPPPRCQPPHQVDGGHGPQSARTGRHRSSSSRQQPIRQQTRGTFSNPDDRRRRHTRLRQHHRGGQPTGEGVRRFASLAESPPNLHELRTPQTRRAMREELTDATTVEVARLG